MSLRLARGNFSKNTRALEVLKQFVQPEALRFSFTVSYYELSVGEIVENSSFNLSRQFKK